MFSDDLEEWVGGVGGEPKREGTCEHTADDFFVQ